VVDIEKPGINLGDSEIFGQPDFLPSICDMTKCYRSIVTLPILFHNVILL